MTLKVLLDTLTMLYNRLPSNSVRLLYVVCRGDEIFCNLRTFKLSSTPAFDAVSYVWGSGGRTEKVTCNNVRFQVTPAVKTMLWHLYHHRPKQLELQQAPSDSSRPLWIDTICINQDDQKEKDAQIRLMSSIFAHAPRVIVWLGPEGKHTGSFMYEATSVVQALEQRSLTCPFHWEYPQSRTLKYGVHSAWSGLQDILEREWPTRLWTFQEAVLAQEAVIMCGRHGMDLNVITKIDRLLENGPYDINLLMQEQRQKRAVPYNFPFKDIGFFRGLAKENKCGIRLGVPWLLSQGYRLGGREPVDRIRSFLDLLERRLQAEIIPILEDHDNQCRDQDWKTYMRLTKILLKHDTRLDLLSLSTYLPPTKFPGSQIEKPSWCLDLAAPMPYRTFYFMRDNYRAGISTRPQLTPLNTYKRQTRIPQVNNDNDKILEIPGFKLATADCVVQRDRLHKDQFHIWEQESVETWIDWERECRALARQVYYRGSTHDNSIGPLPQNYLRVHASNMVADADSVYSTTGNDVITRLISLVGERYCGGDSDGFDTPNADLTPRIWTLISECLHEICLEKGIEAKTQSRIGECYQAIERNIGRAFFSTREGKLGLGPPYMKPGDVVCVFYNSGPLHILRFEDAGNDAETKYAIYIGDAYVDGCMDLDELHEEKRGQDEVFSIR